MGSMPGSNRWRAVAAGLEPPVSDAILRSGDMTQDGDQLTGQATLMLVSGPAECPEEMMADIMGEVEGSSFFGMLDGGEMFGGLNFTGTISQDGQSIQGSYEVKPEGPFSNVTDGAWAAALVESMEDSILEIPTTGVWGLTLLASLLALASLLVLRHSWV